MDKNDLINKLSVFNENTPVGNFINKMTEISNEDKNCEKYRKMTDENSKGNDVFLSVITRTQGSRPEALREVLLCLSAQTDMDFEVLLLGHLLDETKKELVQSIIDEQEKELRERIRYISVDEGNRTTPLNYGFAHANGEYISILDDDDIVFDNWVENFKNGAKAANGRIIRAYSFTQDWEVIDESSQIKGLRAVDAPRPTYCSEFNFLDQLNCNRCPTMSLAYPAYLFQKINVIFDESLSTVEDWDYLMRAVFLCGIYDTKEPTSLYRLWKNTNNSHSVHDENEWLKNTINIQKKFLKYPIIMTDNVVSPYLVTLNCYNDKVGNDDENKGLTKVNNRKMSIISCGQKVVLSPKMYLDFGNGFSEDNTLYGDFSFKNNVISSKFEIERVQKQVDAFRIDLSENTFMVLDSIKVSINYIDGASDTVGLEHLKHNGYMIEQGLAYIKPDPQLVYKCNNSRKISSICLEARFIDCDIQEVFDRVISGNFSLKKFIKYL